MNDRQTKEFDATKECNFAIAPPGIGRFRVSAFVQMGLTGAVLRTSTSRCHDRGLELPPILKEIVLSKRGLVILWAPRFGKSTSLAAMVDYRNEKTRGTSSRSRTDRVRAHAQELRRHQRESASTPRAGTWRSRTRCARRRRDPGRRNRDRDTMEYGIQFAETGHLVLATLHANSANRRSTASSTSSGRPREQLLMDLSLNIRGWSRNGCAARGGQGAHRRMEVMLNTPLIAT